MKQNDFHGLPFQKNPRVKAEIPFQSEAITVNTSGGLDVIGQVFAGDQDGKEETSLPIPGFQCKDETKRPPA